MDAQQILTLLIVAAAAAYVVRRLWRAVTSRDGGHCAGCGECGRPTRPEVRPAPKATPLVTLGKPGVERPRFRPPTPGA